MDIKSLTKKELAGQRLMVGFEGDEFSDDLRYLIGELKVGGIILFSQNITSPGQLKDLCEAMQDHAAGSRNLPLFIAVDQEGGEVARLRDPFTVFPGNPHMQSEDDASRFAEITAAELARDLRRATRLLELPYCGADLVWDAATERHYLLDLNPSAMFAGWSRLSGHDLAGKLAAYIIELARRGGSPWRAT